MNKYGKYKYLKFCDFTLEGVNPKCLYGYKTTKSKSVKRYFKRSEKNFVKKYLKDYETP